MTSAILAVADPADVLGVDTSEGFLAGARARIADLRATYLCGDAQSLPIDDRRFHAPVSGLMLNDDAVLLGRRHRAGDMTVHPIEIRTTFADFDDYWRPFPRWPGPGPG